MATLNGVTVTEPSDGEIIAWWRWAATFVRGASPFDIGWGNSGDDRNNLRQPVFVHCISCTAGAGGRDGTDRPLRAAINSGKDILVPVLVAFGENIDITRRLLGRDPNNRDANSRPAVEFFVDDVPREYFYKETRVGGIDFIQNNSFDEPAGRRNIESAGFWAKVSPNITNIEFGGSGGQTSPTNNNVFDTQVTYRV
jgi:hypothetical protein